MTILMPLNPGNPVCLALSVADWLTHVPGIWLIMVN